MNRIEDFIGYNQGPLGNLKGVLFEPRYTLKDLNNLSYRTINYWEEKNYLLPLQRDSDKKWRRFSFIDYLWIMILEELSDMGVALPDMVKRLLRYLGTFGYKFFPDDTVIDKGIDSEHWFSLNNKMNVAEYFFRMIAVSIGRKNPMAIRFYNDGYCQTIWGNPTLEIIQSFLKEEKQFNEWESFVQISISAIIKKILTDVDLDNILITEILNENEIELLKHIRRKDLSELTIRFTDGATKMIELKERGQSDDLSTRLSDYLLKGGYQEITYKTNGGKSVSFERTTKLKL